MHNLHLRGVRVRRQALLPGLGLPHPLRHLGQIHHHAASHRPHVRQQVHEYQLRPALYITGEWCRPRYVCLLVGCLTSQQQARVSQGRICTDNFTCCHTEIEVADQTIYLTQSQYTDTGPTSSSTDPIIKGVWQGSHWSANF